MKNFVCALASALAVAAAMPAAADDSSAALGAGGLVLVKQADIRMAKEDLYISPKEVRVRYEFANDGAKDVDTVVAFPMPDIDVREFWYEPLGTTLDRQPNFMGFALRVDGRAVEAAPDVRAVQDGRDVTATVRAAGLPLNIVGRALVEAIDKMPVPERKRLAKDGILEMDGDDAHPHWIAKTSYWWHQHFPAGKSVVIEHRYQPVTGQFFFGAGDLALKDPDYIRDYCIDAATAAAVRSRTARRDPRTGQYLQGLRTEFVLRTAANWKGPIGRFRLVLDKLEPDDLLSLCWDGALRKTGATTFEATRDDFAPARDIRLLVLQ